jgi:hypothetical protein
VEASAGIPLFIVVDGYSSSAMGSYVVNIASGVAP